MDDRQIKLFMPEEANRALALVRPIVRDILYNKFQINIIAASLGGNQDVILQNKAIQKFSNETELFLKELEEIGCFYRDFKMSICLVDFPAIIDTKEVFLCWRSNEESVKYYHSLDGGYHMRKLIPEYYFNDLYEQKI